ncbi:hypothetical protein COMNV_01668 [Commensalibacter sp. Nvir]|uniref:hypothetical protein n=1 Tax=Commensalibacter sp. Nvir TaxID=3069817 RepID=UPI002D70AEE9|nr:hypothetical protein COMNV_01668 [Commensalibacter sp. Nvir]
MRIFPMVSGLITIITLNCIIKPSYSFPPLAKSELKLPSSALSSNLSSFYTPQQESHFYNWTIVTKNSSSSLKWTDFEHNLNLFFTPNQDGTVEIKAKVNKNINKEYEQPFIRLNVKGLSIVLNKNASHSQWVHYSTLIHSENEEKLLNELKNNASMHLVFSTLTSINIKATELFNSSPDFTQFFDRWQTFVSTASNASVPHQTLPLDGMPPQIFPLYAEADLYVHKCLQIQDNKLQVDLRNTICEKRNVLLKQLQSKGWCWGSGDSDQHDKDKNWKKCIFTPKGGIEKLNDKKIEDFNKAKLVSDT